MKRKIAFAVVFLAGLAVGGDYPHPRFELKGYEQTNNYDNELTIVEVYHDKDSGIEFICASKLVDRDGQHDNRIPAISCFPTGRKWN